MLIAVVWQHGRCNVARLLAREKALHVTFVQVDGTMQAKGLGPDTAAA